MHSTFETVAFSVPDMNSPSPSIEPPSDDLARVASTAAEIEKLTDPHARALFQNCMQACLALHGAGLQRILHIVNDAGVLGGAIREAFLRDKTICALLLIHGLHPQDIETRVRAALTSVLPYIHSHGGHVELLTIDDGIAKLRLQGACKSCPSSAVTIELAIKQAVSDACPDLLGIEVVGAGVAADHNPGQS